MEVKYERSIKIKFISGKEILLTVEEYNELFGYTQPYRFIYPYEIKPYISENPPYPTWITTTNHT